MEELHWALLDGVGARWPSQDGSGHGLLFVRHVVESEMSGRLQLIPVTDGTGACFELQLPTEENTR